MKNNQSIEYLLANVHTLALVMVNVTFDKGNMENITTIVLDLDSTTRFA